MLQDTSYVADVLSEAIEEMGPANVVQVVMDGAAVCIAAGALLEER